MQVPFHPETGPRRLTLDEAVQVALRQNPSVLAAEQEIERTRGQVIEVRAQALPQITMTATFQEQDRSLTQSSAGGTGTVSSGTNNQTAVSSGLASTGTAGVTSRALAPTGSAPEERAAASPRPTATPKPSPSASATAAATPGAQSNFVQNKTWVVTVQARQLLYSGGQVGAGIRIAHLTEDQTIFHLRDVVDTIISTVRQQFYTVLVNKALIGVQQEQVTLLESQLSDQKNRFEAGTVPRFNVLQAEVALANAQPPLIQARNNYHIAQLTLAKTLGYETRDLPARQDPFTLAGGLEIEPVYTDLAHGLEYARLRRLYH